MKCQSYLSEMNLFNSVIFTSFAEEPAYVRNTLKKFFSEKKNQVSESQTRPMNDP